MNRSVILINGSCDEKRGTLHRKEGDGNESTREKEDLREDGWTE